MTTNGDKPFVALLDLQNGSNQKHNFSIIQMNDPCTGIEHRQYLTTTLTEKGNDNHNQTSITSDVTKKDRKRKNIYEVQSLSQSKANTYSSFFVGSRVVSNPSLHLIHRIDPLFLLLPYFELNSNGPNIKQTWQPWQQICASRNINTTIRQIVHEDKSQLRHFFQINDTMAEDDNQDDFILYKFQNEKVSKWLGAKVHRVESTLTKQLKSRREYEQRVREQTKKENGDNGAFSSSFVLSEHKDDSNNDKEADDDDGEDRKQLNNDKGADISLESKSPIIINLTKEEEKQILRSSLQIICEYISPQWQTKLLKSFELDVDDVLNSKNAKSKSKEEKQLRGSSSPDNVTDSLTSTETPSSSPPAFSDRQMTEADKLLHYTMGGGGGATAGGTNGASNGGNSTNDKKRKNQQAKSVGLKRLQKVNTKGMKSLSSFFSPSSGKSKKKAKKS